MGLLILYVLIALGFSFLCSIAEAVLLSITPAYIALLTRQRPKTGRTLNQLKQDIGKPLAAILTLNTIAHTIGAAGAGAQATVVFGNAYLGIASAILTLLILVFSEIIPKTLGAHYWRQLAPVITHVLKWLVWLLYPFVKLSEWITGGMTEGPNLSGFSRQEFAVMAEVSAREGQLDKRESEILKNVMAWRRVKVSEVMTPRTVVFSLPSSATVESFFIAQDENRFSRVPVYEEDPDNVTGFVLRSDVLLAQARGEHEKTIGSFKRELPALPETANLAGAFRTMQSSKAHMALVVDEYGDVQGIITLEDLLETLLGLEIVDESDSAVDMRELARKQWQKQVEALETERE